MLISQYSEWFDVFVALFARALNTCNIKDLINSVGSAAGAPAPSTAAAAPVEETKKEEKKEEEKKEETDSEDEDMGFGESSVTFCYPSCVDMCLCRS